MTQLCVVVDKTGSLISENVKEVQHEVSLCEKALLFSAGIN